MLLLKLLYMMCGRLFFSGYQNEYTAETSILISLPLSLILLNTLKCSHFLYIATPE